MAAWYSASAGVFFAMRTMPRTPSRQHFSCWPAKTVSIRTRASVGSLLYAVAYRLALRTRADRLQRQAGERSIKPPLSASAAEDAMRHDLRSVLDNELSQLPEKYRAAVVLCDLEGKR